MVQNFKRKTVPVAKVFLVNGPQMEFLGGEKTAVVFIPHSAKAKAWLAKEVVRKTLPTTTLVEVGTVRSKQFAVYWDGRESETSFLDFLDFNIAEHAVVEIR